MARLREVLDDAKSTIQVDDGDEKYMEIDLYLKLEKMKSMSKGTRICARLVEKLLNLDCESKTTLISAVTLITYLTLGSASVII